MQAIGGILHRKCTLGTNLGVRAFEPSLFEPRVSYLVKMNGDFAGTGKSVRPKRGVRAYRGQASEVGLYCAHSLARN